MNIREIEVVSELVNYQNFSEAAYSLSYSPSIISKYVASVEEELGVKLFIRGNKSSELSLSPEGKVLIQNIQRINIEYQRLLELAKQLKRSYDNVIRVGSLLRFGNETEQEILASFLCGNPDAEMEQVKMHSRDLLRLLRAGKLDAMFVTLSDKIRVEDYYSDLLDNSDVEIQKVSAEPDLYLAISEKFLPEVRNEAPLGVFRDFTFMLPMREKNQDTNSIDNIRMMAKAGGFEVKTAYMDEYDTTVFRLAAKKKVAVAMTSVDLRIDGIKFIRITDWEICSNLYFLYLKSNKKKLLLSLKQTIEQYVCEN